MIETGRRGASNLAPVLMVVSFAAMVGFLTWLGMTSEGTESVLLQEDDTTEMADSMEMAATPVTAAELGTTPDDFVGDTVRVTARVDGPVGSEAFFLDFPQSPFLVKMGRALAARQNVPSGSVTVTGTVRVMTDSIRTAWAEAGLIGENDIPLVDFATHFIQADRLRQERSSAQQGRAGGQGGSGQAGDGGDGAGAGGGG